ncbi:DUF3037 domain-containing protein [Cupriavidus gilardii]|uniref:DUF3037 domain-containing protein n=1 Tax=Cupriavidus gilardii TaxID=82541 RepID=UPI0021BFA1D1|nr:DUF3037 domain-containing protein [Cupriavidus gilardii]MCT9017116.1 DUF3037 domain-containing protein [Cupriavidus gilardii]MCT9056786.1 DUF3037 domain-containing protein [Cupriavidus gilardii]
MKYACQYAIVRFLPFAETGEFANIGVAMVCPKTGFFDYKLLRTFRRITAFFEELDSQVYRSTRDVLREELDRIKAIYGRVSASGWSSSTFTKHVFGELVRPRESMIRFSEVRAVLAEDPATELDRVFDEVVGRNFATKAYQEKLLERHVRGTLKAADLVSKFKLLKVGNDTYHATFPFVALSWTGKPEKAIKPLHLAHEDPAAIYDHGWEWLGKLRRLGMVDGLPERVLLAVNTPTGMDPKLIQAHEEVMKELRSAPRTSVVSVEDEDAILNFARN